MTGFLDLEAYLGGEFLHPGGRRSTLTLLTLLNLQPGEVVLDIGCGTGATALTAAQQASIRVVGLDRSKAMLASARERVENGGLASRVDLTQADAKDGLPFRDSVFDAVYAESVLAILPADSVVNECVRVLRPGGRLALTERIWKPGLSQEVIDQTNTISRHAFGIPAATCQPLDQGGWLDMLEGAGLRDIQSFPIDSILETAEPDRATLRRRVDRWHRYASRPKMFYSALSFKRAVRQHPELWANLESYLFIGTKPG